MRGTYRLLNSVERTSKPQSDAALRYQQAIDRIKGIVRSSVSLGSDGQISEVHIIASPERPPKRIVRDVESLLVTRFGVRIDYRRVSLVQLDPEEGPESPLRLRFSRTILT